MKSLRKPLLGAIALLMAAVAVPAQAADSINLGAYSVAATYGLDILGGTSGGISGLEASAVTYAKDRGTLFFVGDEGTGVIEISTTGQTLGSMAFNWANTGSKNHDTEGLTYLGDGKLVVTEERLQDAYSFTYAAGGSATLASSSVSIGATVKNVGIEGISYDPRDGSFVTIKQEQPQDILSGQLSFAAGTSTMASLFDASTLARLGLSTLSDVQTLSPVDSLVGSSAADNLLILSLGSRKLIEVTRTGVVKSFFDLSTVLADNGIEGVTVDHKGNIYLIAEQLQLSNGDSVPGAKSQLIVLTAPVPEPESYAMLLAGLGLLGFVARRRRAAAI